jgi:predicted HicB family RNase H-like nuclease
MSNDRKIQLGARIDPALHRKLKILAAKESTTIGVLVEEAVRMLLNARKRAKEGNSHEP